MAVVDIPLTVFMKRIRRKVLPNATNFKCYNWCYLINPANHEGHTVLSMSNPAEFNLSKMHTFELEHQPLHLSRSNGQSHVARVNFYRAIHYPPTFIPAIQNIVEKFGVGSR